MKTNFFLLLVFIFNCISVTYGQIEVTSTGKVRTGNPRPGDDYNNETTVNIFGLGTDPFRTGSRVTFGDYGAISNGGANILIGEHGGPGSDSDILQLHGKNGINFTINGQASVIGMKLKTNGQLHVKSTVVQNSSELSDVRLKRNVSNIEGSLDLIKKLQGIRYDFYPKPIGQKVMEDLNEAKPTNEKERQAVEKAKAEIEQINAPSMGQYGFSAQDIQKIMPEIVTTSEDGYLAVNYSAFIPILVEALKEQQKMVDKLTKELEEVKNNCCKK